MNIDAANELEELRRFNGGKLNPHHVVDRARSPNSALHRYFEWDDGQAAEAYRLQQARQVIRAVVQYIPRQDGGAVKTRVYVSLPSDRVTHEGYRAVAEVIKDKRSLNEAMIDLQNEILRLRVKFGAWQQLQPILDDMMKLAQKKPTRVK